MADKRTNKRAGCRKTTRDSFEEDEMEIQNILTASPPPVSAAERKMLDKATAEIEKSKKKIAASRPLPEVQESASSSWAEEVMSATIAHEEEEEEDHGRKTPSSCRVIKNTKGPTTSKGAVMKKKPSSHGPPHRNIQPINYVERAIDDDPEEIRKKQMEKKMGRISDRSYTIGPEHIGTGEGDIELNDEESACLRKIWMADNWDGLTSPCESLLLDHFLLALPDTLTAHDVLERGVRANANLQAARCVKYKTTVNAISDMVSLIQQTHFHMFVMPKETIQLFDKTNKVMSDCVTRVQGLYQENLVLLTQLSSVVKGMKIGVSDLAATLEHKSSQMVKRASDVLGSTDEKTGDVMGERERTPSLVTDAGGPSTSYSVSSRNSIVDLCLERSMPTQEDPAAKAIRERFLSMKRSKKATD